MRTLIIFIAVLSFAAIAQNKPDPQSLVPQKYSKELNKKPGAANRVSELIGKCTVIPGVGNLIETPCTDVILTLNSKGGTDPISTRTDHDGAFQFTTEPGVSYKMVSGSKFYDVVSPTGSVSGGENIEVHLRQK